MYQCRLFHRWLQWDEPKEEEFYMLDCEGGEHEDFVTTQKRKCERCGKVQVREVGLG